MHTCTSLAIADPEYTRNPLASTGIARVLSSVAPAVCLRDLARNTIRITITRIKQFGVSKSRPSTLQPQFKRSWQKSFALQLTTVSPSAPATSLAETWAPAATSFWSRAPGCSIWPWLWRPAVAPGCGARLCRPKPCPKCLRHPRVNNVLPQLDKSS